MANQYSERRKLEGLCRSVEASMESVFKIELSDQEYAMLSMLAEKKNLSVPKMLHEIIEHYFNGVGLLAFPAVSLADVLRSEYRLRVLAVFFEIEINYVGDILRRTGLTRNAVKAQLVILEKMQLIEAKKYGERITSWRLKTNNPKVPILRKIIEDWYPLLKEYVKKPSCACH